MLTRGMSPATAPASSHPISVLVPDNYSNSASTYSTPLLLPHHHYPPSSPLVSSPYQQSYLASRPPPTQQQPDSLSSPQNYSYDVSFDSEQDDSVRLVNDWR